MGSVICGTEFNYRIDTEYGMNNDGFIAEGTESIVFKGIKYGRDLRYSCALKFKPKPRLKDFMNREYKILELLQTCRSVVRILDVIEDLRDFIVPYKEGEICAKNYFCVVEEYIEGDSLQDFCIKQWFTYNVDTKKWERNKIKYAYREIVKFQNQIIQFMINLCEIMKFVSNINGENGKTTPNKPIILHCDIKPENIMVTKHGRELVLIDFGRSQQFMRGQFYQYCGKQNKFSVDYSDSQWQGKGKENIYAYGTVGYAAPECYAAPKKGQFPFPEQSTFFEHGKLSVESDIFAFGATFFECISIYKICRQLFEGADELSDPRFFNLRIREQAEINIRNGDTKGYCDRDFRDIDEEVGRPFHEALEAVLCKCTKTRTEGFQNPKETTGEYYHNFYELQNAIERARDIIPSLDRKSDPLVRQMFGISGFCAAAAVCFLAGWLVLLIVSNLLAQNRWEKLKRGYSENKKRTELVTVAEDMMDVWEIYKQENFEKILGFMYGGSPNDKVIDNDETELLTALLKEHISDQSEWVKYLDTIIQYGKSNNMEEIAEKVYEMNLADEYESGGYILAKALTEVDKADDEATEKLKDAFNVVQTYSDEDKYKTIVSKLAIKLMSGRKTDTIAEALGTERETIQDILAPLIKDEGE